jgi:hypothetical protein
VLIFLAGLTVALAVSAAFSWRQRRQDERRFLDEQLAGFGRPIERERDLGRLGAHFAARQAADPSLPQLHDRAWVDLDLDLVFAALDRTASQVGAQVLYDRLRRPSGHAAGVAEIDSIAERLASDAVARERLVKDLMPLRVWHASYLSGLFWGGSPEPLRFGALLPVLGGLPMACVLLAFAWPRLLIVALLAALVNVWIRIALRPVIDPHVPAIRALPAFIRAARSLVRHDVPALREITGRLGEHLPSLRFLHRAARWIVMEPAQEASLMGPLVELGASIQEYTSTLLLRDVNAFHFTARRIALHRGELRDVFHAIGTLDVALSIASIRAGAGTRWCRPVFTPGERRLDARGLVHPLLREAVPNDVSMDGRSWLVTGSNMSGKSTLLRTVGVNAVLARALGTVLGTHWEGPPFTVRTCIGRGDSIVSGKSYYLAEAEAVRELLQVSETQEPHLFILDELFRGTNTVERIAAGRAVLEYLDRGPHLVLVATHDIELTRWLGDRYDPFHFREQVVDGALTFDYLLKPGVSSTRNAIAWLEALGYPPAVVSAAHAAVGATDARQPEPPP